jgi:hypothetical protein
MIDRFEDSCKMPLRKKTMKELYSLYISLAALVVSVFSLGWNFYRDVILKPRLKATVKISKVVQPGRDWGDFIDVSAVNLGPGAVICNGILFRKKHSLRFWKKPKYFCITEDYTNPLNPRLPKKLEVGDSLTELFTYKKDAFLSLDPTHVGVRDTFGKMHWASKKSLKEAKKEFFKEFKKKESRT